MLFEIFIPNKLVQIHFFNYRHKFHNTSFFYYWKYFWIIIPIALNAFCCKIDEGIQKKAWSFWSQMYIIFLMRIIITIRDNLLNFGKRNADNLFIFKDLKNSTIKFYLHLVEFILNRFAYNWMTGNNIFKYSLFCKYTYCFTYS